MTNKGLSKKTVYFFIDFIKWIDNISRSTVGEFKTKTSIIAKRFGVSEPTIRRYIKQLKDNNYLIKKDNYNNDNPNKPYIESSTYELTSYTNKVLTDSVNYSQRDRNVFFNHKSSTRPL